MRTILAKINILANAFEKDGNIETAELLHDVFIKISKKKSKGKNVPNNPSLWAQCKSQAKQKFDVYPSAYANGWAAKQYKAKGGTWRKASVENVRVAQEAVDMSLDPQVRKEQKDIKDKQTFLSINRAKWKIQDFIFSESGDFQSLKVKVDDFISKLNIDPNSINELKEYGIFLTKLKVNEPTLDETLYIKAYEALNDASYEMTRGYVIHSQNIGRINNYLRKKRLNSKVYFTALEMARLKSTGQAPQSPGAQ
jgi:hypothetical protein